MSSSTVRCERIATLSWKRDDEGVYDYGNPAVIPLTTPRIEEVFPPLDRRTHRPVMEIHDQ